MQFQGSQATSFVPSEVTLVELSRTVSDKSFDGVHSTYVVTVTVEEHHNLGPVPCSRAEPLRNRGGAKDGL